MISLAIAFILAVITRFSLLDRIPNAISGDELVYQITAKSVMLTGKDITGIWSPLSLLGFRYPPGQHQAELPYALAMPLARTIPFSLLSARIPFVLLSLGIVILLYLFTKRLLGRNIAGYVALVSAINPWLIFIGRTSYESTPATFFYLFGFYLLLSKKRISILLSIPCLLLGFYSYIGMKLIFLPLVLLYTIWAWYNDKKNTSAYKIVSLTAIGMVLFFVYSIFSSPDQSRTQDLLLPNATELATQVDHIRKTTMDNPLNTVFINKATVYTRMITTRFLSIFSPSYLFLEGDEFYGIWRHGFFYIIDGIFLIVGFIVLFWTKRKEFILLTSSAIISTWVHVFNTTKGNFCYHIALLFVFLIVFIGTGISWTTSQLTGKKKNVFLMILTCIYLYSAGKFMAIYFFQYPLGGYSAFPIRVLSRYTALATKQGNHVYISTNAYADTFMKYLFYTNTLDRETIASIRQLSMKEPFTINNVTFMPCDTFKMDTQEKNIFIRSIDCGKKNDDAHISISLLSDAGEQFQIFQDTLCSAYPLKRYASGITPNDFAVEKLGTEKFCTIFINRF